MRVCNMCGEEKILELFAKNGKYYRYRCKACEATMQRDRIRETMRYLMSLKEECSICGYNKCKAALEFHHIDPSNKEFNLTQYAGKRTFTKNTKEQLDKEVAKCVVLCANCHREEHERLDSL